MNFKTISLRSLAFIIVLIIATGLVLLVSSFITILWNNLICPITSLPEIRTILVFPVIVGIWTLYIIIKPLFKKTGDQSK